MTSTPVSLLERLKRAKSDGADWQRLQEIYLPLIQAWLARTPGLDDEASDLSQEVFMVLIRELPHFERQREGSFRTWLRRITVNRIRTYLRQRRKRPAAGLDAQTTAFLSRLEDPASDLAKEWDRQHDRYVFEKLLSRVAVDFADTSVQAFRLFAIEGKPAAEVATRLGISENAVLVAKARILKRLREEAAGLID